MKKLIICAALVLAATLVKAKAQNSNFELDSRPDTSKRKKPDSVHFAAAQVLKLFSNTDAVLQRIHKLHIDAMLRDTLDKLILENQNILLKSVKQK